MMTLMLFACKKAEDRKCLKSAGQWGVKEVMVPSFQFMDLGPKLKYVLVQDTVEKVILRGGKNLLNFIETSVTDGNLVIRNNNKCNFLRSYKHEVTAEIHLKNVFNVTYEGTKSLKCYHQLDLPYLTWLTRDGAGSCKLNLKSKVVRFVVSNGWGNFEMEGETDYLKLDIRTNGFGDAYNLQVNDSLDVVSTTSELLKVNANGVQLRAELSSNGDVWYIGTPGSIEYNRYGSGELINKN